MFAVAMIGFSELCHRVGFPEIFTNKIFLQLKLYSVCFLIKQSVENIWNTVLVLPFFEFEGHCSILVHQLQKVVELLSVIS